MTAEQLEELLWNVTQGATMNVRTMARAELNILAASLARRVIAAEKLAMKIESIAKASDCNRTWRGLEKALTAYREDSK